MAARSKALVCGRSPAGIVGLKPAGGMDGCLVCVLSGSLLLTDHSSREIQVWCVRGDVPKGQVICIYKLSWRKIQ